MTEHRIAHVHTRSTRATDAESKSKRVTGSGERARIRIHHSQKKPVCHFAPGTVEYKNCSSSAATDYRLSVNVTATRYATNTQWRPRRVVPLITRGGTNRNTKQNAHSTQFSSQPNCRLHAKCWWRARIPQHHTIM